MQTPQGILNKTRQHLTPSSTSSPSLLTGFEQTKLSWARRIESPDQVPAIYRDSFGALSKAADADPFPYTLLTPSFEGFLRRANEKLVCSLDDKIHILEKTGKQVTTTSYAFANIYYIEIGSVLLKSWIRISGIATDNNWATCTLRFNTVTDYLFKPMIAKLRATGKNISGNLAGEQEKFEYLLDLNFKFRNYARNSIRAGDCVSGTLLQPEIRTKQHLLMSRIFPKIISPAHLSILTNRELIIIKDDEDSARLGKDIRYGGVWSYIPLNKISAVSLTAKNERLLILSVRLSENDHVDSLFAVSNRQAVESFASQLEQAIPTV